MKITDKLCVAVIEPVGGHGGMNYYDFGLCNGLTKAGAEVFLFTCDKTVFPENSSFVGKHGFYSVFGKDHKLIRGLRFVKGLFLSLLRARNVGAMVCHYHFFHFTKIEYLSVALARFLGFSVVVTVHDVESFSGDSSAGLARKTLELASGVIVHNQISASEVVEKIGVSSGRLYVIPHGNYLPYIDGSVGRQGARSILGIPLDKKVSLFFGQIKEVKGLDLLLAGFKDVVSRNANVLLVIAGKVWKDDFGKYSALIEKYGLSDFVKLDIRYIPDEEAALFYRAADLVVLPYRRIYQSGVLLMAMSYGRAVLVSDLPGMTEVVSDEVSGFVFKAGDSASLTDAMHKALVDDSLRESVAEQGLSLMRESFDWDGIGLRTVEVYRNAIFRK
ncbi:glycosyltransferase family 4 protein [Zoogloea dura]|uniref:Glycosyltransferase family 4 protein n=1 Tax=Zoogloea dura TaxID=2728840 RepID=A0A848GA10_9RHOO|nr:glycosyltransferase family 4 protein [Zoogloea dura]NML29118.1 glycosyltransferase family 4 protein [Zoogloea dura]